MATTSNTEDRAKLHSALGDPLRLAIVDELMISDRAPIELQALTGLESNLLAHHLDILERAGLIMRSTSSGDGRRRYVRLITEALDLLHFNPTMTPSNVLFICSMNSARSQIAAALWTQCTGSPAQSAGTHPAAQVHPGAVAAAQRAGLDLRAAIPRAFDDVKQSPPIVITVCDQAHEEIGAARQWPHWSIPDPVLANTKGAFDQAVSEIRARIRTSVGLNIKPEGAS